LRGKRSGNKRRKELFLSVLEEEKGKEGGRFLNKNRGYCEKEVETLQEKRVV